MNFCINSNIKTLAEAKAAEMQSQMLEPEPPVSKMTAEQLANWMINADIEIQIIRGHIGTIADTVSFNFPDEIVPFNIIEDALALAQAEPTIQLMRERGIGLD